MVRVHLKATSAWRTTRPSTGGTRPRRAHAGRAHRQHQLGRGTPGQRRAVCVLRREGRHRRAHAGPAAELARYGVTATPSRVGAHAHDRGRVQGLMRRPTRASTRWRPRTLALIVGSVAASRAHHGARVRDRGRQLSLLTAGARAPSSTRARAGSRTRSAPRCTTWWRRAFRRRRCTGPRHRPGSGELRSAGTSRRERSRADGFARFGFAGQAARVPALPESGKRVPTRSALRCAGGAVTPPRVCGPVLAPTTDLHRSVAVGLRPLCRGAKGGRRHEDLSLLLRCGTRDFLRCVGGECAVPGTSAARPPAVSGASELRSDTELLRVDDVLAERAAAASSTRSSRRCPTAPCGHGIICSSNGWLWSVRQPHAVITSPSTSAPASSSVICPVPTLRTCLRLRRSTARLGNVTVRGQGKAQSRLRGSGSFSVGIDVFGCESLVVTQLTAEGNTTACAGSAAARARGAAST